MAFPKIQILVPALLALGFSVAPAQDATSPTVTYKFPAVYTVPVVKRDDIRAMTKHHGSKLLVVNFWATWCIPCVEELPYFQALSKKYDPSDVRVVGVSVDFDDQIDSQVIPFIRKKKLEYPVVVYFDDQQEMIEFFSDDWQGDLPATFIYNAKGEKVDQMLGKVEEAQLNEVVSKHLKE